MGAPADREQEGVMLCRRCVHVLGVVHRERVKLTAPYGEWVLLMGT